MPSSLAFRSTPRKVLYPSRWPRRRPKPRDRAQRPFPSMIMAMCWGRASTSIPTEAARTRIAASLGIEVLGYWGIGLAILTAPRTCYRSVRDMSGALQLLRKGISVVACHFLVHNRKGAPFPSVANQIVQQSCRLCELLDLINAFLSCDLLSFDRL